MKARYIIRFETHAPRLHYFFWFKEEPFEAASDNEAIEKFQRWESEFRKSIRGTNARLKGKPELYKEVKIA